MSDIKFMSPITGLTANQIESMKGLAVSSEQIAAFPSPQELRDAFVKAAIMLTLTIATGGLTRQIISEIKPGVALTEDNNQSSAIQKITYGIARLERVKSFLEISETICQNSNLYHQELMKILIAAGHFSQPDPSSAKTPAPRAYVEEFAALQPHLPPRTQTLFPPPELGLI